MPLRPTMRPWPRCWGACSTAPARPRRRRAARTLLATLLLPALFLSACSAPRAPLVTEIRTVPLTVPAELLECPPEPPPPAGRRQSDVARWILDLIEAGGACRDALAGVKALMTAPAAPDAGKAADR